MQCITQEVCKVIVSNIWSEFVNFPEKVDQMVTVVSQMEESGYFPVYLVEWMAAIKRERSIII